MNWTLITGASEGLGREFADLAACEGRKIILTARQEAKLQELAADLTRRYGVEVVVIPADLAVPGEAERLWSLASTGRVIDVLVNNAGLGRNGDFADASGWARERASIEVNVTAATALMKLAVVAMVAEGSGRVLNVASVAGFLPGPNMAVYHATKAYFLSLSEAVGAELAGTAVKITALCPGATQTNFFAADDAEKATILTRLFPLPSARSVAVKGWAAMKEGRRIRVTGLMNSVFAFSPRLFPRRFNAWLTGQFLRRR
jgi:short-subunit dehydrogenase